MDGGRDLGLGQKSREAERQRERPEATFATALPMAQKGAPKQILQELA